MSPSRSSSRRPHRSDVLVIGVWVVAMVLVAVLAADALGSRRTTAAPATTSLTAVASVQPTTTQTVSPPSTTVPAPTSVLPPLTLAAGGDVLGDRQVGVYMDKHGGEAPLAEVAHLLSDAHVAFVNLESPLSDKGTRNTAKEVTFRGRVALVDGLVAAGVDVVSLANNHALDWGAPALLDTIDRLTAAGVANAGAGADLAAARAPALLDTPAGTVAVLAYTSILPEGFAAGAERAGVNPTRPDEERLLADVRSAAEAADWVVVSLHWGVEYEGYANAAQREFAHALVDAGADLVLGHHPHVLQGFELYRDKLIAYSLGDFVFDHYSRATGEAVVLRIEMTQSGPPTFTLVPVYLTDSYGIPWVVTGAEADTILDRVAGFSERLGLQLERDGDVSRFTPR